MEIWYSYPMKYEEPREQLLPEHHPFGPEYECKIDDLPTRLGFSETPELKQLKEELLEAYASDNAENTRSILTRYHILGEEMVNEKQGPDYMKAQVGLIVAIGLLKRDMGRHDDYIDALEDALVHASNMDLEEIALAIRAAGEEAVNKNISGSD